MSETVPSVTPPDPTPGAPAEKPPVKESTEGKASRKVNKAIRFFKYFVISALILTTIEIGVAYWLVSSRWHLLLSSDEMIEYADRVNEAEPMPENFMRVYKAIFPHHVNTTLTQQVFVNYGTRFLLRHTELDDKPHCFCDMVYDIQKQRHQELEDLEWDGRLQDLEFGFGIEKYSKPENCFNYVMQYRVPELLEQLSMKRYSHLKSKSISEMNDDELLELILLLKSRSRYSRHKNPAKFDKAFAHYRERLQEAYAKN
jgi:hypothetical protein